MVQHRITLSRPVVCGDNESAHGVGVGLVSPENWTEKHGSTERDRADKAEQSQDAKPDGSECENRAHNAGRGGYLKSFLQDVHLSWRFSYRASSHFLLLIGFVWAIVGFCGLYVNL